MRSHLTWDSSFKQLPSRAALLVLAYLICSSDESTNGQEIRKEFLEDARKKWMEVRQKSYSGFSFRIKRKEFEFDKTGKETRKILVESTWYSQDDFVYRESIPIEDSNTKVDIPFGQCQAKISNGKEAVMIRKAPGKDSDWELIAREKLKGKFQFRPETIKPGWYQFQPRSVVNSLALSLSNDPRLQLGRTSPLEFYIQFLERKNPDVFDSFTVTRDSILGRIVVASFKVSNKSKNGVKTESEGTFSFLADWNWLPLSMKTVTRIPKTKDRPARQSTQTFSAAYDKESIISAKANSTPPVPDSVTFESSSSPDRGRLKIENTFRPLPMKEVAEISLFRSFQMFD